MLQAVAGKSRWIEKVYRIGSALFMEQEAGILRVTVQDAGIVRVSYTENGSFSERQGETFCEFGEGCSWSYEKDREEIRILTDCLVVRISRADGHIRYEETDGRLLLQEACGSSKTVEAFDAYRTVESESSQIEKVQTPDGIKTRIKAAQREFDKTLYHTRLSLCFQENELLFGLGQAQEGVWNLRHTTQYLHQANLKIAVPMLLSGEGYGILLTTQSPAVFEDTQYGSYIYTEADEYLDYYFLAGALAQLVRAYRRLTGRAVLLPKWAFGYIQSKERYESARELIETAAKFREQGFPLDCIVLDWMSWEGDLWGQKSFDRQRFPDPAGMIQALHEKDVRFMMSIWPNMSEKCKNYEEFKQAGLLFPNSEIYDAFQQAGRDLYWKQTAAALFCHGVDAWWCDSSEPVAPEWERMYQPPAGESYRNYVEKASEIMPVQKANAYGLYHARAVYEGQRRDREEKRVVNLTRNGYTGGQKYGTILWSGDISASWDTLRKQIVAGLQFCSCGLPFWTLDIGAFFVKKGAQWFWNGDFPEGAADMGYRELYVRWFQYGAFLPIFRSHGTECSREPWVFGEEGTPFYDALKNACLLRYSLMPYIYSLAGLVWKEDGLMMRPLFYDFPQDKKAAQIADQFMFGPAFLVCPVSEPMLYQSGSRKVQDPRRKKRIYLPEGAEWYDFYTQKRYAGGQEIEAELCIERIPLYVRAGSIIPMQTPQTSTALMEGEAITLRVYPGADGAFSLYEDAGDGYGYEQGDYCFTTFVYKDRERHMEWTREGNPKWRRGEITIRLEGIAEKMSDDGILIF